jgi:hypothetical protein
LNGDLFGINVLRNLLVDDNFEADVEVDCVLNSDPLWCSGVDLLGDIMASISAFLNILNPLRPSLEGEYRLA